MMAERATRTAEGDMTSIARDLGRHDAEIKGLYAHMDRLTEALEKNTSEIAAMRTLVQNAKGGYWAILRLGNIVAFIAGVAGAWWFKTH